ncbi:MAG: beta-xylosidase [Chitinispirillaceae bacterium]
MVEALMLWNEPNNLAHWDFITDPDWRIFADMIRSSSGAIRAENNTLPVVLGGISPIDPDFLANMRFKGVLECVDVVGVHGFPFDWNHWTIQEWPQRVRQAQDAAGLPVWATEVGVSTFGADELQDLGIRLTARYLSGKVDRLHWYSLFDLPRSWSATSHDPAAEGSEYLRHFHMGLVREDGVVKPAMKSFADLTPGIGICQWFHPDDHRLEKAVKLMRSLGVKYLRTGLSWADSLKSGGYEWFDRQMRALDEFHICLTLCYTPESRGINPHHSSPPRDVNEFAEFCARVTKRYCT